MSDPDPVHDPIAKRLSMTRDAVQAELTRESEMSQSATVGLLVASVSMMLVVSALVASIGWVALSCLNVPWWALFFLSMLGFAYLVYDHDVRSRPDPNVDQNKNFEPDWTDLADIGRFWASGSGLFSIGTLLWGPRSTVKAWRLLKGRKNTGHERFIERAAELVTLLSSVEGPTKIVDLVEPGESSESLNPLIVWLDHRDWIGIASDQQRLWISTKAKNKIGSWGFAPPPGDKSNPLQGV